MLIEFAGLPRTGKTTVAQYLEEQIPGIVIHPERFDLVPDDLKEDPYKYNLWYAQYTVNELLEAQKRPGVHLFERGVLDRIAYGKANELFGRFSSEQLKEYMGVLMPHVSIPDLVFVFNTRPEVSLSRTSKRGITANLTFLNCLFKSYKELKELHPNLVDLPLEASLDDLKIEITDSVAQKVL